MLFMWDFFKGSYFFIFCNPFLLLIVLPESAATGLSAAAKRTILSLFVQFFREGKVRVWNKSGNIHVFFPLSLPPLFFYTSIQVRYFKLNATGKLSYHHTSPFPPLLNI